MTGYFDSPSRMRKPMLAQSRVFDGGGGNEGIVKMVQCYLFVVLLRVYVRVARLRLLAAVRESDGRVHGEIVSQRTEGWNGALQAGDQGNSSKETVGEPESSEASFIQ